MEIRNVRGFIRSINPDNADSIDMRMIQKAGDGVISFAPQLSVDMKQDLKNFYREILDSNLFEQDQTEYNPNIAMEGTLQISNLDTAHIREVINDIESEDNLVDDIDEADLDKLNYYSFKFNQGGRSLYIFRRFTKMKKIRNGIFGVFHENSFTRLEATKFFGIDRDIDIMIFEDEVLIINRFALQTIFKLKDYFTERATLALETLNREEVFENFNDFETDCINDKMAARRMTKIINTPGRIEDFIQHIGLLQEVIEQFHLEFELNEENKIKYNGSKKSRNQILNCISDAYYKSVILQRPGADLL